MIQPMMEVVNAELYCVHSRMEYIRTKLRDSERNQEGSGGDKTEQAAGWGGRLYPMMQERTNCPVNIGSRHPLNARPYSRHTAQPQHRRCGHTNVDAEEAHRLQVTGVAGVRHGGQRHDQGVVVEQPVFSQLLKEEASAWVRRK